jgi:hypothetical protein
MPDFADWIEGKLNVGEPEYRFSSIEKKLSKRVKNNKQKIAEIEKKIDEVTDSQIEDAILLKQSS